MREEYRAVVRSVRADGWTGRRLSFRSRFRYLVALVVVSFVVMLSGCMEALQSGQSTGYLPPSALPSVTDLVRPSVQAVVVTETPTVAIPTITATVMVAPEPTPTTIPTTTAIQQPSPTPAPTFELPTALPQTNEQRWRAQEIHRIVVEPKRTYTTSSSELWWFDPINQQHIILGAFTGDFLVQAQFTLRSQGIEALEVPYQVNKSYGLTALSPAILARVAAAGSGEWIETYVFMTPNVLPR